MTQTFTPEVGERIITQEVRKSGVWNMPPKGTPIVATLGETRIVGRVAERISDYPIIVIEVAHEGTDFGQMLQYSLWIKSGWTFEITGEASK